MPELVSTWSQPAGIYEVAVASPVYFIPGGFHRPEAAMATVRLNITDENGHALSARVSVTDFGKEIEQIGTDESGNARFSVPATASITIKTPGFTEARKDLFMDSPVYAFCKDFNDFYTPAAFNRLREIIGNLSFEIRLKKI